MSDGLRLYGLNAVVTNAADGIGEAVARTLAKHGASVLAADVEVSGVEQHFRSVKGVEGLFADMHEPHRQGALIEAADLVTEMTLVKHPFRSGVKAQAGIEF